METEQAISLVQECLNENLFEPSYFWPDQSFEERSYSRWAACEIWERLLDRPREDPDLIVANFMFEMALFANSTDDSTKKRIFSIARDTAEDILTLF